MLNRLKTYFFRIIKEPKSIFLDNVGFKQTLVKNTLWLALAEGVSKLFKLFLFIYIARVLGASEYGKFNFALSFVSLFLITSELGLFSIVTREFARNKVREKDFPTLFSLKLGLSLSTFLIILIGSFFITQDGLIRKIILILGVQVLLSSLLGLFFAFFRARERMEYQSIAQMIEAFLTTIFGVLILVFMPSVVGLSWTYLLSTLLVLIFVLLFFNWKFYKLRINFSGGTAVDYFKMSYPLAAAGFLASLAANFDSTLMGFFGQITENGWYGAMQRVASVISIPITFITMSFIPVLSKFSATDNKKWQKAWNYHLRIMMAFGLPFAIGGWALSAKLIYWVYDGSFWPAMFCLRVLLLSAAFSLAISPFRQALVAADQQKKIFWLTLFTTITSVALNLLLVKKYSLDGAAIAFLASAAINFALAFWFTSQYTSLKVVNREVVLGFLATFLASAFMGAVLLLLRKWNLHIVLDMLIASSAFIAAFLAFSFLFRYGKFGLLSKKYKNGARE